MSKQGKALAIAKAYAEVAKLATIPYVPFFVFLAPITRLVNTPHTHFLPDGSLNKRKIDSERRKLSRMVKEGKAQVAGICKVNQEDLQGVVADIENRTEGEPQ